jgi:hypothetical protein
MFPDANRLKNGRNDKIFEGLIDSRTGVKRRGAGNDHI